MVFADDHLVVVDKPAGLVVHPGAGNRQGTLVQQLLVRFPDISGAGPDDERPGIVHRLDKGTSGLLVVARTAPARQGLVAQLAARSVERRYLAVVHGELEADEGVVEAPLGRSPRSRLKMAVVEGGRQARTHYRAGARSASPLPVTLVTCRLETGRTHQVRAHFAAIGHPVLADQRYAKASQFAAAQEDLADAEAALAARRPLGFRAPGDRGGDELHLGAAGGPASRPSGALGLPAAPLGKPVERPTSTLRADYGSVGDGAGYGGQLGPGDPPHHVGDGEGVEVRPHVLAHLGPHRKQGALALVVAGPPGMGLAEVADHDGPVHGRHHLAQGQLLRQPGQDVATAHAPFGTHQAGALQGQEYLLQVGLGKPRALGDVPDGGRLVAAVQRQRQQRPAGVITTRGHPHAAMLQGHGAWPAERAGAGAPAGRGPHQGPRRPLGSLG